MVWRHVGQSDFLPDPLHCLRLHLSVYPEGLQITVRGRGGGLRGTPRKKLIDIAQDVPTTVILAEDDAGLYLQATTTRVWAPRGQPPVVRADPGHAKTCFYGTLNLQTGHVLARQSQTLNAEATATHLEQILATYPDVPILLLWDRAPWHRGPAIRALLAAHPRLDILPLPVAAPDP